MQRLAAQIKELRLRKKLTQDELATLSGVHECTIYYIESETHVPNIKSLKAVAKALECEIVIQKAEKKEKKGKK